MIWIQGIVDDRLGSCCTRTVRRVSAAHYAGRGQFFRPLSSSHRPSWGCSLRDACLGNVRSPLGESAHVHVSLAPFRCCACFTGRTVDIGQIKPLVYSVYTATASRSSRCESNSLSMCGGPWAKFLAALARRPLSCVADVLYEVVTGWNSVLISQPSVVQASGIVPTR